MSPEGASQPSLIRYGLADRIVLAVDGWLRGRDADVAAAGDAATAGDVAAVDDVAAGDDGAGGRAAADLVDDSAVGHAADSADSADSAAADYPAAGVEDGALDAAARRLSGRLMRVNHAGEVAAQALYLGQSAFARDPGVRGALGEAAREERAHLDWCRRRLDELAARPSRLDPFWWAGSFAIGAAAGAAGDAVSLGFVAETERQVVEHLAGHLDRLPPADRRSRAICRRMMEDERAHGTRAVAAGGRGLPLPVRAAMRAAARVMTATAYRV